MFVFSNSRHESPAGHGQGVWKSLHKGTDFCLNAESESSGLYIPCDSSAYSTTRCLSECCEDRCTSSAHNVCLSCNEVQANSNSTSVCLSSMKAVRQKQQQNMPVALMAATQSSLVLNTLTRQSPREPCADHLVCATRISEMHTTVSSSAINVCYLAAIVDII